MILYLGNNLKSKQTNLTTLAQLSGLLNDEGFTLKTASSLQNQILRLFSMLWSIIKYSNRIDYVLIDTYSTKNFYYAFATSQMCRLLKLKYIPVLHGGNLPYRLDKSPRLSKYIFSNSYKNVTVSKYLKHEFKIRGFKATFIPNVLEIEKYNFLKRGFSYPKLLYVRAFANIYNPEMAIKVLGEIIKVYPKAVLCMVGPEKDNSYEVCKALVKSLKLENHVEFTGLLSKQEWHKKAEDYNIFINTTNIDNAPVSVMEAMALGLPIVSTNVGGMPFLIDNNQDGILVEPDKKEIFVNSIRQIINHPEFAKSLTIKARKKVEQFDWKTIKYKWIELLQ